MEEQEKVAVATPAESEADRNFKELRNRTEQFERKAEESARRVAELESALEAYKNNAARPKMQLTDEVDDDVYVDGRHHKQALNQVREEIATYKKEMANMMQIQEANQAELQLKAKYSDFDQVVTSDNLKKLAESDPQLMKTIMANEKLYDKGYASYALIKKMLYSEKTQLEDQKIQENKKRPVSSSAAGGQTGDNPLAHVSDYDRIILTKEDKERLRRMREEIRLRP